MRPILCLILLFTSMAAGAQNSLSVLLPITYLDGVVPPAKVKAECAVESYLQTALEKNLSKRNSITFSDAAGSGRTLRVQVQNIERNGGGSWTGAKSLTVRVELSQDGAILRKAAFSRSSRKGLEGTCEMLNRCAEALGSDVEKWVMDPRHSVQDAVNESNLKRSVESPAPPSSSPAAN